MSIKKLIISLDQNKSDILNELYENVRKMGGVDYIRIFEKSNIIKIIYDDAAVRSDKILSRISSFGLNISKFLEFDLPKKTEINEYQHIKFGKILILLISLIVFFFSESFGINKYVSFILYFGIVLWVSYDFRYEMKKKSHIFNIYLITLVYFFSFLFHKLLHLLFPSLFRIEFINWYEATILVFIIYIGFSISKYLFSKVELDLKMFLPNFFKVIDGNYLQKKDWRDLKLDEIVLYEKGDLVGCDGVIVSGSCIVDESLIKGSEIGEKKSQGDKIYSGSFISDGKIEAKVLKKPESSLVFNIVKNSFSTKTRKVGLDRIPFMIYEKHIFLLPIVFIVFILLSLKGLTGFLWLESLFISFFITYPYLIWLIFPVSYMFLLSSGIKRGFSIKNTDSIDFIVKSDSIVFLSDKYVEYKTVNKLKSEGFELILISNKDFIDKEIKELFNEYYSNVDFEEKEGIILKKKIEGKRVIGIGDCVYELDALSECDVSIIVAVHPESTLLPCDVVFLKKDVSLINDLISYSKFIFNVVKKNSFLVLFFHLILLPIIVLLLALSNKKELIEKTLIFSSLIVMLLIFVNSLRIYLYSKD